MANSFYNEALDLLALNEIEESGNQQNLVSINTLFDKAIKNAQIIEKNFYETKYIDDAYFILGMSSFYQNKISASKYYFERLYNEYNEDDFFNSAIEAGAEDCFFEENTHEALCMPDELSSFYTEIEKKFGEPESSGFQWKPSSLINVTGDKAKSLFNLLDDLENDEDVQQVFSNFDVDDSEIEDLV